MILIIGTKAPWAIVREPHTLNDPWQLVWRPRRPQVSSAQSTSSYTVTSAIGLVTFLRPHRSGAQAFESGGFGEMHKSALVSFNLLRFVDRTCIRGSDLLQPQSTQLEPKK